MSQLNPPPPPPPPPPFQPNPPTQPGLLGLSARATRWPTIVGVIAIVLGVLFAVGDLCGILSPAFQDYIAARLPAGAMKDVKTEPHWIPWLIAASGMELLLAIVLICGGSGLMRRASWAPRLLRIWAVLFIVAALGKNLVYFQMGSEKSISIRIATSGPAATMPATMPTALPPEAEKAILAVGLVMGLGYACAFPIFILIWLAREPVRDEIRTWHAGPAQ